MSKNKDQIVYIMPVKETREYIEKKYPNDEGKTNDFVLYVDEEMPESECREIVDKSNDPVADSMTLRQFQGQFNFALEDGEITSNKYLIKIF